MTINGPLAFSNDPASFPADPKERHECLVDLFGQFLFWIRRCCLENAHKLTEDESARQRLGSIRSAYFEAVAHLPPEQRKAALGFAEENLNLFIERLLWSLGDEGTDARIGSRHAYRFRIEMEIVDVESTQVIDHETINRGGRFFGSYWGRWLNRFGKGDQRGQA